MQIDWKSEFSLGIPQMDAEHYQMIQLMGRIEEAKGRPDEIRTIWRILQDLLDYVSMHFLHEEALMERAGYLGLEEHKALHRQFRSKVQEIECTAVDAEALHHMLRDWQAQHIMKADRAYVAHVRAWLRERGEDDGPE